MIFSEIIGYVVLYSVSIVIIISIYWHMIKELWDSYSFWSKNFFKDLSLILLLASTLFIIFDYFVNKKQLSDLLWIYWFHTLVIILMGGLKSAFKNIQTNFLKSFLKNALLSLFSIPAIILLLIVGFFIVILSSGEMSINTSQIIGLINNLINSNITIMILLALSGTIASLFKKNVGTGEEVIKYFYLRFIPLFFGIFFMITYGNQNVLPAVILFMILKTVSDLILQLKEYLLKIVNDKQNIELTI